ncbi:MAG: ribonuclease [Chitinophagales bacterium]|nr:ribonuclease [Chitinophagales bacterium]
MNQKAKKNNLVLLLLLLLVIGYKIYDSRIKETPTTQPVEVTTHIDKSKASDSKVGQIVKNETINDEILELTKEEIVVAYLKEHHRLPDYYITKSEAQKRGWIASSGNLCEVLPGRAIGGDTFGNRERLLPMQSGRKYFEADINYNCGTRNADRLVFSNDNLIFITKDHYQTFQKQ